jgi:LPXTG-motif cell wall-anchored protein
MLEWMTDNFWAILGGGGVILVALLGVLYYLRNKRED